MGIYGNGLNIRDWLYVEDHVKSLYVIINNGEIEKAIALAAILKLQTLTCLKKFISL